MQLLQIPEDPAVIYLGAGGGGIWKTSNATPGMSPHVGTHDRQHCPPRMAPPSNQASLQVGGAAHSLSVSSGEP